MNKHKLIETIYQLEKATIQGSPLKEPAVVKWHFRNRLQIRHTFLKYIRHEDWEGLKEYSVNELKLLINDQSSLKANQVSNIQNFIALNNLYGEIEKYWVPVKKNDDWDETERRLRVDLTKRKLNEKEIDRILKKIINLSFEELKSSCNTQFLKRISILNSSMQNHLSQFMAFTLAKSVAGFNLEYKKSEKIPFENLSIRIRQIKFKLSAMERNIWIKIISEENFDVSKDLEELNKYCDEMLSILIKNAAIVNKKIESKPYKKYLKLSIEIAEVIRMTHQSVCFSKWIEWNIRWNNAIDYTRKWKKATSSHYYNIIRLPKIIKSESLLSNPTKYDGKLVSIEGMLEEVRIYHKYKKAISSAYVINRYGKKIEIVLPYIKLDSGGMTEGAYARVAGVFYLKNKELNGRPGITMKRINYTKEAEKKWFCLD